jgi:hypothetical protein
MKTNFNADNFTTKGYVYFIFLGSRFRASFSTYVYKYPTRCNSGILFYYKITLHVSGTLRAHYQEYINPLTPNDL